MALVDSLLKLMSSQAADVIVIPSAEAPRLERGGEPRPLSMPPLGRDMVEAMVGELVDAPLRERLGRGESVETPYAAADGPYAVLVEPRGDGPRLTIRRAGAEDVTRSSTGAAPSEMTAGLAGGVVPGSGGVVPSVASVSGRGTAGVASGSTSTPAAQAAAAAGLARAHEGAARQLSAAPVGPYERGANSLAVTALRRTAAGYRRAATAARGANARGYTAAGRLVRRGGRSIRRALAQLAALGYTVQK